MSMRTAPDGGSAVGIFGPEFDDGAPLTNPNDWNARIHGPHLTPLPRDGEFYILTDDGLTFQVGYYAEASWWMRKDTWGRNDGESGMWTADEIVGWSRDHEDIEEAAMLFLLAGPDQ